MISEEEECQMNCPKCNAEPFIREGTPVKTADSVEIVQIYKCANPQCENHGKDIGEVRTDIFDNSKQIEVIY
jgi:hypothetical protein